MSRFHEEIKLTLIEVERFILKTVAGTSLSAAGKKEKASILAHIDNIRENYSSLLPPREGAEDDVSGGTADDGSNGSAGGTVGDQDDSAYSDSIAPVAATELYNTAKGGMLLKRRKPGSMTPRQYQKRWCVLKGSIFYYFEKHTDKRQTGAFYVSGYEFRDAPFLLDKEPSKKDLSFELIRPGHRVYQFLATSKEDYNDWKEAINKASVIVERPSPKVTATKPTMPAPEVEDIDEELYEPINETQRSPPSEPTRAPDLPPPRASEPPRPVSEEIYDDIAANQEPGEVYDDCDVKTASTTAAVAAKKMPQVPQLPPPQIANVAPPQLPSRVKKDETETTPLPKLPELPPRNPKQETPRVVFPDFTDWKLGELDDYGNMFYGKWDCEAGGADELGFKRGDVLHVLSRAYDAKQWWVAELAGKVGLVPRVFLTEAYQLVE